jgi:hypothetical protein
MASMLNVPLSLGGVRIRPMAAQFGAKAAAAQAKMMPHPSASMAADFFGRLGVPDRAISKSANKKHAKVG